MREGAPRRLTREELLALLDGRVRTSDGGGDGPTDQIRVYRHIVEQLESGDRPLETHAPSALAFRGPTIGAFDFQFFTDFCRFFGLSWETSLQTDLTPEASEHSGSRRIELSSKSTAFLKLYYDQNTPESL